MSGNKNQRMSGRSSHVELLNVSNKNVPINQTFNEQLFNENYSQNFEYFNFKIFETVALLKW